MGSECDKKGDGRGLERGREGRKSFMIVLRLLEIEIETDSKAETQRERGKQRDRCRKIEIKTLTKSKETEEKRRYHLRLTKSYAILTYVKTTNAFNV